MLYLYRILRSGSYQKRSSLKSMFWVFLLVKYKSIYAEVKQCLFVLRTVMHCPLGKEAIG